MSDYWFRPKKFGYGLEPCSWQGWIMTLILIGLLMFTTYINFNPAEGEPETKDLIYFVIEMAVIMILFMAAMRDRVKGKMKWNWGKRKDDVDDEF